MTEGKTGFSLHEVTCPACGAPRMGLVENKRLTCAYCGSDFVIAETVCPQCGSLNQPGHEFCSRCGTSISRLCPACGTRNWGGADCCEHCGRKLDLIEHMSERWATSTKSRLQQQMSSSAGIKEHEEERSRARMAALWEVENRRQQLLREDLVRREHEQQRFLLIFGVVLFLMLAGILIAVLVTR